MQYPLPSKGLFEKLPTKVLPPGKLNDEGSQLPSPVHAALLCVRHHSMLQYSLTQSSQASDRVHIT